ncbi:MAG: c-type cytochrome [Bacteroidetes bacterium]|nr:c-type cytochrome [Bacteroidota bacterium]
MRKVFKVLLILLVVIVVLVGGLASYVKFAKPDVGAAQDIKVEITPERVARGEYLANCVTVCMDCHSKRDWSTNTGPLVPGTLGQGGERFDRALGFPGVFYSRNITPAHLKDWTDGEILRAITTGVDRKGEPLMPVMPYVYYGKMDTEDIYSIIAYIRSLPEIKNEVPAPEADFPFSMIMRIIPKAAAPEKKPTEGDTLAYGKYLVNAAGCVECHTKWDKKLIAGTEFGGGRQFQLPGGVLTTPNISPDMETGIGAWTKEAFIRRFKSYVDSTYIPVKVNMAKDFVSIMPWTMYGNMKESDLAAIYTYLRTVPKQVNTVTKWQPGALVAKK